MIEANQTQMMNDVVIDEPQHHLVGYKAALFNLDHELQRGITDILYTINLFA